MAEPDDHRLAREVAVEAGELLVRLRSSDEGARWPQRLRDEGDRRSHELIMERLRAARPDLEAMAMRSRVSESEALLDPAGLGGFTVAEWIAHS